MGELKILVVGDSMVGKSNLLSRFTRNEFELNTEATVGADYETKDVDIDGKIVKAQVWDSAGQERFGSISNFYYRRAVGALIVYDITQRITFQSVKPWLKELAPFCDTIVARMLVGNKCDLENRREVDVDEAKTLAEEEGLLFMETSALDSTNVHTAFEMVIRKVLNSNSHKIKLSGNRISLVENWTDDQNKFNFYCCA